MMEDREIDNLIKTVCVYPGPSPDLLHRIDSSVQASLRPVRPLLAPWILTAGVFVIAATVAVSGAARAGFLGIEKMLPWERAVIFPVLVLFAILAAVEFVNGMVPGRRRYVSSGTLLTVSIAALLCAFALCFRNYHTTNFVSAGLTCLITGLLHALPVSLLSWLLLRRGFAVRPVMAGLTVGMLSGLAGLGVLELHCSNFEAMHVLVWHTSVVLLSAIAGGFSAWLLHRLRA